MNNNRNQENIRRRKQLVFNDAPITTSVTQSILELRAIYSEMSDKQFAKWYSKRYSVNNQDILDVLMANKLKLEKTSD